MASSALIYAYAENIGLKLSEEFLHGIINNTKLLTDYAKLLEGQPLSDIDDEPAYEYVP